MATESLAHPRTVPNGNTREERALELYRTRGHEIRQASPGEDLYLVPSCTGPGFYSVDYRTESCDCPDHLLRRENCKHILAVGIHVAKRRARPVCACIGGYVYVGYTDDSEAGVERSASYPCRRCSDSR